MDSHNYIYLQLHNIEMEGKFEPELYSVTVILGMEYEPARHDYDNNHIEKQCKANI